MTIEWIVENQNGEFFEGAEVLDDGGNVVSQRIDRFRDQHHIAWIFAAHVIETGAEGFHNGELRMDNYWERVVSFEVFTMAMSSLTSSSHPEFIALNVCSSMYAPW